jgi:ABC-type bacteriocin/lantibiotic exporter with double-glycine peptidase domain
MLTLGDLLSFYGALALLRSSGNMALAAAPLIIEGRAAAERIDAAVADAIEPEYRGTRVARVTGDVVFDRVVFGYGSRPLLTGVNLRLQPGDVVGISGESGAGKTTIAMLLVGLYRPLQGTIALDDIPLAELDLMSVRRQIGTMPQDPLILHDTVRANLTYGLDDSAEAERDGRLGEAMAIAEVDEFIAGLPEGADTVLGTRGVNLSGGQRQRLALARALVKRPRLIVMDEPTNHLGTSTVTRVIARLAEWPAPPTILIISHDPELLSELPQVLHLSDGVLSPRARPARGDVQGRRVREVGGFPRPI